MQPTSERGQRQIRADRSRAGSESAKDPIRTRVVGELGKVHICERQVRDDRFNFRRGRSKRTTEESRQTYGSRRVHAELTLGAGIIVGHGTVDLLMRRAQIKGLPGNRRPKPKHQTPTSADLVHRQFARPVRNQLWVTDITEHPTREGRGLLRGRARYLVPAGGRLVHRQLADRRARHQCAGHGHPQPGRPGRRDHSFRSRRAVTALEPAGSRTASAAVLTLGEVRGLPGWSSSTR